MHRESPDLEVSFTCSINGGVDSLLEIVWSGPVDLPETTVTHYIQCNAHDEMLKCIIKSHKFLKKPF